MTLVVGIIVFVVGLVLGGLACVMLKVGATKNLPSAVALVFNWAAEMVMAAVSDCPIFATWLPKLCSKLRFAAKRLPLSLM